MVTWEDFRKVVVINTDEHMLEIFKFRVRIKVGDYYTKLCPSGVVVLQPWWLLLFGLDMNLVWIFILRRNWSVTHYENRSERFIGLRVCFFSLPK